MVILSGINRKGRCGLSLFIGGSEIGVKGKIGLINGKRGCR